MGPKKDVKLETEMFLTRLANPDFPALEVHFGCTFPESLRALYADKDLIKRDNLEATPEESDDGEPVFIAFFEPADMETVKCASANTEPYFTFADDGCGNPYMCDPRKPDPEVYFFDQETGEKTLLHRSLKAFLSTLRDSSLV